VNTLAYDEHSGIPAMACRPRRRKMVWSIVYAS
jgi:hypothetical protein